MAVSCATFSNSIWFSLRFGIGHLSTLTQFLCSFFYVNHHGSHFHSSLHCFFVDFVFVCVLYVCCLFVWVCARVSVLCVLRAVFVLVCVCVFVFVYLCVYAMCVRVRESARVSALCARPFTCYRKTVFWNIGKNTKKPSMAFILWWCIVYAWKHYTNIREKISIAFLHTQPSVQTKNRKVKLWHTITSSEWTIHLKHEKNNKRK